MLTERFYRVQMNALNINLKENGGVIPNSVLKCKMLILTSKENHDETVKFFEDNNYFGGDASLFEFFSQAMLPAVDLEGRILMESAHEVKLAPNGNGGLFDSIMKRENIRSHLLTCDYVQVIGVDNIMNKILDPIQIGFSSHNKFIASLKSCPKANAGEKVGVVAKKDG